MQQNSLTGLPFHFQDLIRNSPFLLLYASLVNSEENLGHYKDKIFWMIHLPILITCLLNNALIM